MTASTKYSAFEEKCLLGERPEMKVSQWLDAKTAEGIDVSHIELPDGLAYESPDETIYFKEIRRCSILCTGNHPFATVERFGHWYCSRGADKEEGKHTTKPQWRLFTRNRNLAIKTAREHIEGA